MRTLKLCALASAALAGACGSTGAATAPLDGGSPISLGDAASAPFDAAVSDADIDKPMVDGGYPVGDGGVIRADRFVTKATLTPGDCAGFGLSKLPFVVEGPPVGGGDQMGSLDVVSLGNGGEIVLSFGSNAIVDGPGVDFIVFENPFLPAGNAEKVTAEPGEVSVSDDGVTWKTYPCTATAYPYDACAGWHPVYSNPQNGISPVDPMAAGGDAFDLAAVGLQTAHFVRIRDMGSVACPQNPNKLTTNGFDLDAVSIVNAKTP